MRPPHRREKSSFPAHPKLFDIRRQALERGAGYDDEPSQETQIRDWPAELVEPLRTLTWEDAPQPGTIWNIGRHELEISEPPQRPFIWEPSYTTSWEREFPDLPLETATLFNITHSRVSGIFPLEDGSLILKEHYGNAWNIHPDGTVEKASSNPAYMTVASNGTIGISRESGDFSVMLPDGVYDIRFTSQDTRKRDLHDVSTGGELLLSETTASGTSFLVLHPESGTPFIHPTIFPHDSTARYAPNGDIFVQDYHGTLTRISTEQYTKSTTAFFADAVPPTFSPSGIGISGSRPNRYSRYRSFYHLSTGDTNTLQTTRLLLPSREDSYVLAASITPDDTIFAVVAYSVEGPLKLIRTRATTASSPSSPLSTQQRRIF